MRNGKSEIRNAKTGKAKLEMRKCENCEASNLTGPLFELCLARFRISHFAFPYFAFLHFAFPHFAFRISLSHFFAPAATIIN